MFIGFPPTFIFPSGLPKTFLPTHHIFYSQRLFDMKDGLPKHAKHKEGAPMMDEDEDADTSHGRRKDWDKHAPKTDAGNADTKESRRI